MKKKKAFSTPRRRARERGDARGPPATAARTGAMPRDDDATILSPTRVHKTDARPVEYPVIDLKL